MGRCGLLLQSLSLLLVAALTHEVESQIHQRRLQLQIPEIYLSKESEDQERGLELHIPRIGLPNKTQDQQKSLRLHIPNDLPKVFQDHQRGLGLDNIPKIYLTNESNRHTLGLNIPKLILPRESRIQQRSLQLKYPKPILPRNYQNQPERDIPILYLRNSADGGEEIRPGTYADRSEARGCVKLPPAAVQALIDGVKLRFYWGMGAHDFVAFPLDEADKLVNSMRWKANRCANIYIFDYLQSVSTHSTREVVHAYLNSSQPCNALVLDWGDVTFKPYPMAVAALAKTAAAVATAFDRVQNAGATLCHIAGLGLGAHMAGHVAAAMRNSVDLVIGLNPSGPLFYPPRWQCQRPLQRQDARCVQVVHTHVGGMVGAPGPTGSVDIFVNGARHQQPACNWWNPLDLFCSHNFALALWKEAIQTPGTLLTSKCTSWEQFLKNQCPSASHKLWIGQSCSNESGDFYMWTRGRSPYGLGVRGARPGPRPLLLLPRASSQDIYLDRDDETK